MNNQDLGLNQFLMPNNSPITSNSIVNGYQFDYSNERNIISSAKIRSLSWDVAQGGTATLGGAGNGDGVLSVQNSGGTEVVRIDNTGILITGGSIVIKNDSGGTILDQNGVVSTTNFTNNGFSTASAGGLQTLIYPGNEVDITGGSLNVVLDRTAKVLFLVDISSWSDVIPGTATPSGEFFVTGRVKLRLGTALATYVDTVGGQSAIYDADGAQPFIGYDTSGNYPFPQAASMHHVEELSAGTTTFKLAMEINSSNTPSGGSGTAQFILGKFKMSYVILGT